MEILFSKLNSNLKSAEILIANDQILDAMIILRSALETALQIKYLKLNPDDYKKWQVESEIQIVKNYFMELKNSNDQFYEMKMNEAIDKLSDDAKVKFNTVKNNLENFYVTYAKFERMYNYIVENDDQFNISRMRKLFFLPYDRVSQVGHGAIARWQQGIKKEDAANILQAYKDSIYTLTGVSESICNRS